MWLHGAESGSADFKKLFAVGLNGVIKEAENRLKEIASDSNITAREYLEQRNFLEAATLSLKAAIIYAQRYAEKAKDLIKMTDATPVNVAI